MASAAAVAADASRPSLPDNLGDDQEITGAITSLDDPPPDENGEIHKSTETGDGEGDEEVDVDDLFGDGVEEDEEEATGSPKHRRLDDEDLDSGDDLDRHDRTGRDGSAQSEEAVEKSQSFLEVELPRHSVPEPSDNELYLMKVPRFLNIEATGFHIKSFQPPTTDHHSTGPPSGTFSAYSTAITTLRWRKSPSNPAEVQSNARILRWSDGTLTLQLASDPLNQYEIEGNALAPPQRNPPKPTPTSIKGGKHSRSAGPAYNAAQDSFTYLTTPIATAGVIRTTNKITTGLTISATENTVDEAMEKLEKNMAATGRTVFGAANGVTIETIAEDPEMEKRRAEAAEREKLRMAKTREKQQAREQERANRAFGRTGLGRSNLGLSVGGLEGEGRGVGGKRAKPRRQRRDDYSDDEEYGGRRGINREDEYDEEDDFIAGSDEEDEVVDDDEDEDDGIVESPRHGGGREGTPKRPRVSDVGGDEDGDGDGGAVGASRTKRRRVVDDDEDE